jgi:hypothetical protein
VNAIYGFKRDNDETMYVTRLPGELIENVIKVFSLLCAPHVTAEDLECIHHYMELDKNVTRREITRAEIEGNICYHYDYHENDILINL